MRLGKDIEMDTSKTVSEGAPIDPAKLRGGDVIRFPYIPLGSDERYRIVEFRDTGIINSADRFLMLVEALDNGEIFQTGCADDSAVVLVKRGAATH